jgi:hypothetical protein
MPFLMADLHAQEALTSYRTEALRDALQAAEQRTAAASQAGVQIPIAGKKKLLKRLLALLLVGAALYSQMGGVIYPWSFGGDVVTAERDSAGGIGTGQQPT